jgi:hypothetical protein
MDDDQTSNPEPEQVPGRESESASEQLNAAIPELPPDADKNERIRLANLIGRQIAYYVGQKETGTFIAFMANLAIIPRIFALKRCLVRSEDFIQAAKNCRVGKNDAYAIVRLRLDKVINDIKLDGEIAKRKAEAKGLAFDYPDLKAMIKEYTPPPVNNEPPPAGDGTADADDAGDNADGEGANGGARGGGKSNRTLKDYRRENLELAEANRLLTTKLAKAEAAARMAEEREATLRRDRDAAELRLADTEARLAASLRANNNRAPDNPSPEFTPAGPDVAVEHGLGGDDDDDGEIPFVPFKNTDPPRRIRNAMLKLDEIKALESNHHIKGWRGHGATSHARQFRADFIAQWDTIEPDAPPPQRLMDQPPAFWESQHDALIGDLIPAHPDDDPPHTDPPEPPPTAPTPPNDDPEPPPAASLARPATDDTEASPPAAQPVPEPSTEHPDARPSDYRSAGRAADAIYRLVRNRTDYHGGDLTCEMVADVLKQFPLAEWDTDDLVALGEQLHYCSAWMEHEALTHAYFQYDHTTKLFASTEAVLTYEGAEHGLQIHSWSSIEQQLAPKLADERRRAEEWQREQRGRDILKARLPKVRKLKAMKTLTDEILTCQPTIREQGQRVIEQIRVMSRDDPQFADCTTFTQYLDKANEIIGQIP